MLTHQILIHTLRNPVQLTKHWRDYIQYPNKPPCQALEVLAALCAQQIPGISHMPSSVALPAYSARGEAVEYLRYAAQLGLTSKEIVLETFRPVTHKAPRSNRYTLWLDNIPGGLKLTMNYGSRSPVWSHYSNIAQLLKRAANFRNGKTRVPHVMTVEMAHAARRLDEQL